MQPWMLEMIQYSTQLITCQNYEKVNTVHTNKNIKTSYSTAQNKKITCQCWFTGWTSHVSSSVMMVYEQCALIVSLSNSLSRWTCWRLWLSHFSVHSFSDYTEHNVCTLCECVLFLIPLHTILYSVVESKTEHIHTELTYIRISDLTNQQQ